MRFAVRRCLAGLRLAVVVSGLALLAPASSLCAADDDGEPALHFLWAKSDEVLHVKVVEVAGGEVEEIGVEEWTAKCEIVASYKQKSELAKTVHIRFQYFQPRQNGKWTRPLEPSPRRLDLLKFVRGREYVVFLHGTSGGIRLESDTELHVAYNLTDRWLGVQNADFGLDARLKQYSTEKPVAVEKP